MPLFERYTARLFNAYAKELLPHHTDLDEYWCALYEATNQIVIKIAPTNGFMADLSDLRPLFAHAAAKAAGGALDLLSIEVSVSPTVIHEPLGV
jgi:hypothetical protein